MKNGSFDFYVSEMSISDQHGGGITIQRLLGPHLNAIRHFIHLRQFAKSLPPTEVCTSKSKFFFSPFESDFSRRAIGCTASYWFFQRKVAALWHAKRAAARIAKLVATDTVTALVCPQGRTSLDTIEALKNLRDVRYITWMMDDHLVRYRDGHWQYPRGVAKLLHRHLAEGEAVFTISPALADFYNEKFGIRSNVLFGPADVCGGPVCDAPSGQGPLKIGYFGRVWAWNQDAIAALANAMARSGHDEIHVYAPFEAPVEKLRSLANVRIHPSIPSDRVMAKMREYDAVIIPMSFGNEFRYLTEFNIATKMSECIASGTVTIVYGPAYAAMVRFLKPTGAAVIISSEEISDWNAIKSEIQNPNSRRQILQAAAKLAKDQLSTEVMRSRWFEGLSLLGKAARENVLN